MQTSKWIAHIVRQIILCSITASVALGQGFGTATPQGLGADRAAYLKDLVDATDFKEIQRGTEKWIDGINNSETMLLQQPEYWGLIKDMLSNDLPQNHIHLVDKDKEGFSFARVILSTRASTDPRRAIIGEMAEREAIARRLDDQIAAKAPKGEVEKTAKKKADVDADLAAKRDRVGANHDLACSVKVKTTDPSKDRTDNEVGNYEVCFVQRYKQDDKDAVQHYKRNSSPTEDYVDAGAYLFWCRHQVDDDHWNEGEKKDVDVRDDINDPVELSIPVNEQKNRNGR